MNRKSKIIASVTGIFLVLLILVGLTYAYFLTRINGNTNTKSISVTTDNLELTYGDGNGVLEPFGKIQPGDDVHFTDEGGHEVSSKTFTVTNNGNDTNYVVIIDNVLIQYLSNTDQHTSGTATTFTQSEFSYNLTCVSKNKETNVVTGTCDGVQVGTFPFVSKSILVSNDIAKDIVHEYTLTMHYVDNGQLQNEDMDKGFQAQINIADIRDLNPYKDNTNSLAYNIINNAVTKKNGTELRANPLTKPAVSGSAADEKELSVTNDDYGTSYYYRGGVLDNYVNFEGMCWRIVRIEGDGSVKLILEDAVNTCNSPDFTGDWTIGDPIAFGYGSNGKVDFIGSPGGLKDELALFENNVNTSKLKQGDWCYDNSVVRSESYGFDDNWDRVYTQAEATNGWFTVEYFGAYKRIDTDKQPSLKCTGQKLNNMYVGTITVDEASFAGGYDKGNYNYYLINDYFKTEFSNYNLYGFWVLSLDYFVESMYSDLAFYVGIGGSLGTEPVFEDGYYVARPAVSLKSGTVITGGFGTQENPYIIG